MTTKERKTMIDERTYIETLRALHSMLRELVALNLRVRALTELVQKQMGIELPDASHEEEEAPSGVSLHVVPGRSGQAHAGKGRRW